MLAALALSLVMAASDPALLTGERVTEHFRIRHTARSEKASLALEETIERTRDRFQKLLGRDWPGVTEIRVGMGRDEMEALALEGSPPPAWAEALAYPEKNLVLLDVRSLASGGETLRHELAHVALGQLGGPWPHWFHEGLAQHLTGERRFSLELYAVLWRAVQQGRVFELANLSDHWPHHPADVEIAYAQSAAFVEHLAQRPGGPQKLGELLDGVAAGEPFPTAFGKAFRTSLDLEERAWKEELPNRYGWLPVSLLSSAVWAGLALLCAAAFWRYRLLVAKRREALAVQEAEEEEEEARRKVAEMSLEPSAPAAEARSVEEEDGEETLPPQKPTVH
jgi:hypothetical protein